MTRVRRALFLTSAGRYTGLVVNFFLIAILSRVLSPAEIGVSVIGTMIVGLIEMLRDIATPYIVQRIELDKDDTATAFTCMLAVTVILGAALVIGAEPIGRCYGYSGLVPYFQLLAVSLLPGPVERPIMALMQRDMAFERLTIITIVGTTANAAVAVGTALSGFSFMSFAWAALAGNVVTAVLALCLRPDYPVFRLSLTKWRRVLPMSAYNASWALASRIPDVTSTLLLGRVRQMDTVGLYNRARTVNDLPGKLLLSGLAPVVFPALAEEARAGRKMARPYLLALTIVTALHWPGFLVLAVLARPIVEILLGPQWLGTVPLVQIIALANILAFPKGLTQPSLMAMGAFRDLLLSAVVMLPVALILATTAATFGARTLAWSLVVTAPLGAYVELSFIRRHARFSWFELFVAVRKSVIVAVCTAAAPAILVGTLAPQAPIPLLLSAVPLAAAGWIGGLYLTAHPLADEFRHTAAAISARWAGARAFTGLRNAMIARHETEPPTRIRKGGSRDGAGRWHRGMH
ncbi:MAG: oligosaccharide flippase family protein [Acetobacteraceae bacterium]